MAYVISDRCIDCRTCMDECPNLDEGTIYEGKDHLEIDPDKCMECGSCAEACPIEAIDLC